MSAPLTSPLGGDDLAKALRDAYGQGSAHANGDERLSATSRSYRATRDAWIAQYMARLPAAEPIAAALSGTEARERITCDGCSADITAAYLMCDWLDGRWCRECFGKCPCPPEQSCNGKDEGCPTFSVSEPIAAASEPREDWSHLSPQEIVRRTRCQADCDLPPYSAAVWRECCDLILNRLGPVLIASAPSPEAGAGGDLGKLERLGAKATSGEWIAEEGGRITAAGTSPGYDIPVWGTVLTAHDTQDVEDGVTHWSTDGTRQANMRFAAACVNYVRELIRSGKLVASTQHPLARKGEV